MVRAEQEQFKFDMTPLSPYVTASQTGKSNSIVGKVVVINAECHQALRVPLFCLSACVGGRRTRCEGRRGRRVLGTSLADGSTPDVRHVTCLGKSSRENARIGEKKLLAKSRHRKK